MKEKQLQTEHLVRKAKRKDPDAFTELINLQMQGMYKVARSILHNDEDAADAIQDTILTCWEKIETLQKNPFFKTWLTKILINHCYNILKQNKNITYTDEVPEVPTQQPEDTTQWQEMLSLLPENDRLIVTLFYAQGFRTKEIAAMLGLSDGAVKTRLFRARQRLEKYYKES